MNVNAYHITVRIISLFISVAQAMCIAFVIRQRSPFAALLVFGILLYTLYHVYGWVSCFTGKALGYFGELVGNLAIEEYRNKIELAKEETPVPTALRKSDLADKTALANLTQYIAATLTGLDFTAQEIASVLHYLNKLAEGQLEDSPCSTPFPRIDSVSQLDLKHLAWNVAHVLDVPATDAARFIHVAFYNWFDKTTIDTTRRTLKDTRSGKNRIPLLDDDAILRMRSDSKMIFADKKEEVPTDQ